MAMLNLQNIPDEIYRKFKAYCALQGKSVKEVVIEMMKERLEMENK